jgi:hypothetical protein
MRALFLCLLILLFFWGCSPNKQHPRESVSSEQRRFALKYADAAGIKKVREVKISYTLPLMSKYLEVIGDEVVKGGQGQYKELTIYLDENFYSNREEKIRIVNFVEIRIKGQKTRIVVSGINTDSARHILLQFYNTNPSYAASLNKEYCPPEECIRAPNFFTYDIKSDSYKITLMKNYEIYFKIINGQIVITGYDQFIV